MTVRQVRFDGYVDGFPAVWDGGITERPRVHVTAQDRMSRFSGLRTLKDPLLEELGFAADGENSFVIGRDAIGSEAVLAGGVQWLYGLQEQDEARTAGDVSGAAGRPTLRLTQTGAGGSVTFGAAGLMPEGTAVLFEPESAGNGLTLGRSTVQLYCAAEWSLWCQFAWSGTVDTQLVKLGGNASVTITATAATITAVMVDRAGDTATATRTVATNDNAPHWVHASVAGGVLRLIVDNLTAATATAPSDMGTLFGLRVGTLGADPVQIAWVGASSAANSDVRARELGALATGAAERSDLRVARWARWVGVDDALVAERGLSDVGYIATGGRTLLECVADLNLVEGGVLFPMGGDLVYHSREHRYNADPVLSLAVEHVDGGISVRVDADRLVNELVASRPRGVTYRARDDESVRMYGARTKESTIYAASDDALRSAADQFVGTYSRVGPYVPQIELNLLTLPDAVVGAVMGLKVGDRMTVTGLPAETPGGSTLDLFVEGRDDTVSAKEWVLRLPTSPAANVQAGVIGDPDNGQIGTTLRIVY